MRRIKFIQTLARKPILSGKGAVLPKCAWLKIELFLTD